VVDSGLEELVIVDLSITIQIHLLHNFYEIITVTPMLVILKELKHAYVSKSIPKLLHRQIPVLVSVERSEDFFQISNLVRLDLERCHDGDDCPLEISGVVELLQRLVKLTERPSWRRCFSH